VAEDDYRGSARSLEIQGNSLSAATVGRVLCREGEVLEQELFGASALLAQHTQAAANPPQLLIVSGDGSRYRTNEADRRKGQPEPTPPRRPPGLIDDRELFWLFGMAAFSTLMGTVIWLGIARYENGARLGSVWGIEKPVARGMLFIWMFMTGVIMLQVYLRTRSLYRMTRREARLMLQDGLWQETRREQERIYRWKKWFRQQSEG